MIKRIWGRAAATARAVAAHPSRRLAGSVALVVIVASGALASTAKADNADRITAYQLVNWSAVTAEWVALDETGCIETRRFVFAIEGVRSTAEWSSIFLAFIRVTDVCVGVQLASFEAEGTLAPGELSVTGGLMGATLNKTFAATDSVSGEIRDFTVNLTWASTSELDTHTSSGHGGQLCAGTMTVGNLLQHFREAQATGTIAVGGTSTTLDPTFGYIADGTTTSVTGPSPEQVCTR